MTNLDLGRDERVSKRASGRRSDFAKTRLLHTSDVHIGVEHYGEEALFGLQAVADLTVGMEADSLLIAGDLFDHPGLEQSLIGQVFDILGAIGVPVVILPGNHDGLLLDEARRGYAVPGMVRLILRPGGEMITLPEIDISIWGKPVYHHSPSFRPLSGVPARPSTRWYVVMAHGMVVPEGNPDTRSSPITSGELANLDADCVALGHAHGFREATAGSTKAYYCGAPSGADVPTAALMTLHAGEGASVEKLYVPSRRTNEPIRSRIGEFGQAERENGT